MRSLPRSWLRAWFCYAWMISRLAATSKQGRGGPSHPAAGPGASTAERSGKPEGQQQQQQQQRQREPPGPNTVLTVSFSAQFAVEVAARTEPTRSSEPRLGPGGPEPRLSWEQRPEGAAAAGGTAARKLAGELATVPRSPPLHCAFRNRVHVDLRDRPGSGACGLYVGPRLRLRGELESNGQLAPEAVSHGLPAVREAERRWASTTGETAVPMLRLSDP